MNQIIAPILLVASLASCIEGKTPAQDLGTAREIAGRDLVQLDAPADQLRLDQLLPSDRRLEHHPTDKTPSLDKKSLDKKPPDLPPALPDLCPTARICGSSCCPSNELCVGGNPPACAIVPAGSTILFVTGLQLDGNLGGRSGADSKCTASKPAGLACSQLRAFLSVGTPPSASITCGAETDEIKDMPSNYGFGANQPLYFQHATTRHLTKLANSWADALDGSISMTVATGTGVSFGSWNAFWTGSKNDGSVDQACGSNPSLDWNYSCRGWMTSGSSSATRSFGGVGDATTTSAWLHGSNNYLQCNNSFRFLCACKL